MKQVENKAIVLLSGGQDSTTCLGWAVNEYGKENVIALAFDYGQKHSKEIEFARANAEYFGVDLIFKPIGPLLGNSALVDHSLDISAPHATNPDLPASFTPGRNILFFTLAAAEAFNRGFNRIVSGVCQTDFSGYPDCRDEFCKSMAQSLSLGLDIDLKIDTPLMWIDKAETFKLANDLGFLDRIIEHTLTDYNGDLTLNDWGRGKRDNPASEIRAQGFEKAQANGWV